VDVTQNPVIALGCQLATQVVAASGVAGSQVNFVVLVDIEGGVAAFSFLNAVAVAIIDK
jgi:hypothetical protein